MTEQEEGKSVAEEGKSIAEEASVADSSMAEEEDLQYATPSEIAHGVEGINNWRKGQSLTPVTLDELATRLAKTRAKQLAGMSVLSHWSSDGKKPYHHYFRGGIADHVQESIYSKSGVAIDTSLVDLMHDAVEDWERAMHKDETDGVYMRNLLDPAHTHVGIAACVDGNGRFILVEVFIDRYVDVDQKSPTELQSDVVTISGQMRSPGHAPYGAIIYLDSPQGELSEAEHAKLVGPYPDFSDQQLMMLWPWDIECDHVGIFSFKLDFKALPSGPPTAGHVYVQLFVMDDPENIPREKTEGLKMPAEGAICALGWLLKVVDPSADDSSTTAAAATAKRTRADDESKYCLEEQAARREALAMASRPDQAPLINIAPLLGIGVTRPAPGYEDSLFIGVERQEQVTCQNLALPFERVNVHGGNLDDVEVITDIVVLETLGSEEPKAPDGYDLINTDLMPPQMEAPTASAEDKEDDAAAADAAAAAAGPDPEKTPHVYLAVARAQLGSALTPPIVDLSVVYGRSPNSTDSTFVMSGGYETVPLPTVLNQRYRAKIHLCFKREGDGYRFAEERAAMAAIEASVKAGDELDGQSTVGGEGLNRLDDDLLDTSMTPEQIRQLEERRALEMREKAYKAEADAEEQRRVQYSATLRNKFSDLTQKKNDLTTRNAELQRRCAVMLASQKRSQEERKDGEVPSHEAEQQYADTLNNILEAQQRYKELAREYDRVALDLQQRLDEKEAKARDITTSFRKFKAEVSLQAEHSRTGKPMSKTVVKMFQEQEAQKDDEAEKVRLRHINLKMTLRKLEATLRSKEQLAEGLHLIDFEQLKIENQTLNEKIEERNEELHRLKKKSISNIQILTHVKEKLQFVAAENAQTRAKLQALDMQLAKERDMVTRAKREREALRAQNHDLRQQQGFTNSDLLVVDFETRKQQLNQKREQIAQLQQRHQLLHSVTARLDK